MLDLLEELASCRSQWSGVDTICCTFLLTEGNPRTPGMLASVKTVTYGPFADICLSSEALGRNFPTSSVAPRSTSSTQRYWKAGPFVLGLSWWECTRGCADFSV